MRSVDVVVMLADISIVLAIAGAALAVVLMLFKSVESVPKKKVEATKVLEEAASSATASKAAPAQKKAADKKAKKSKKELADEKKKEAEIEAIIAKELALAPGKGLATEKYKVETLDDAKAKSKAKKEAAKKASGHISVVEVKGPSEEQRAKDRAQGFKVVEVKKDDEKPTSPVTNGNPAKSSGRRGTKKATSSSPAAAKREELEKKLSQFFKGGNRRRRNDDDVAPATTESAKPKLSPTSGVSQKKPISAAGTKTWAEEKEW